MAEPPSPPYIPANLTGGYQGTIDRLVMHGTVSPGTYCGAAQDLGEYFRDLQEPPEGRWASCHYGTDPCADRQYVYDNTIAYHAPPNEGSIGIEMCDQQSGPESRWDDADHEAMLTRAANLVRQLCLAYDVPMVWLMPDDLRAGKRGVTDHENVSAAWGETSHTDPGWSVARSDDFMRRVRGASDPEEDDMAISDEDVARIAHAVRSEEIPVSDWAIDRGLFPEGARFWASTFWRNSYQHSKWANAKIDALRAEVAGMQSALAEAVKQSGGAIDLDAVTAAAKAGTTEALAENTVNVDIDVNGATS